jgi:hypothetical protein
MSYRHLFVGPGHDDVWLYTSNNCVRALTVRETLREIAELHLDADEVSKTSLSLSVFFWALSRKKRYVLADNSPLQNYYDRLAAPPPAGVTEHFAPQMTDLDDPVESVTRYMC